MTKSEKVMLTESFSTDLLQSHANYRKTLKI